MLRKLGLSRRLHNNQCTTPPGRAARLALRQACEGLEPRMLLSSVFFAAPVTYAAGDTPWSAITGDFNHDGKLDLAVANGSTFGFGGTQGDISILLGNGDGTFQPAVHYAAGYHPNAIITGDFNGDGKLDLALTDSSFLSPTRHGAVNILLGNGDGTFQAPVVYAVPGDSRSLTVDDFNGDGKQDLAVADGTKGVSILRGNGDGTFEPAVTYAVTGTAHSVTTADFNGDGKADLAVGVDADNGETLSLLLGNGDGTFREPINAPTVSSGLAESIATGDFNGDGKADVAIGNSMSNTATVFLGNGDGTFQPAVEYQTGTESFSISTADFNGDGKADLVSADFAHGQINVLSGNGDGTFQVATNFAADGVPNALFTGDFNGDGKVDLGSANNSGTVSIFLNATGPHLTFIQQPAAVVAGVTVTPAPTVDILDANGALLDTNSNVTLTIANGPAGATVGGTLTVTAQHGVATFDDLSFTSVGTYTLMASANQYVSDFSQNFTISPAAAATLVFVAAPATGQSGWPVTFAVNILDAFGNVVTGDTSSVTLSVASGASNGLHGTTTVTAVNGKATFPNVWLDSGTYTVQVADGTLAPAISGTISVPYLPQISMTSSANPSVADQSITLTATITSTGGIPAGMISFCDEGNFIGAGRFVGAYKLLGTAPIDANGVATFTVTPDVGYHEIFARFEGDATFSGTGSQVVMQCVGTPEQRYVAQAYADLRGNTPGNETINALMASMAGGDNFYNCAATALSSSSDYETSLIDGYYVQYLGRHAEQWGLSQWLGLMHGGWNAQQVRAGILGSPEYFQHNGGTNATFVTALYRDLLERSTDAGGLADWTSILNLGADTISGVAARLANSDENRTLVVTDLYEHYLHRAPEPQGLAAWKNALAQGISQTQLVGGFISSPEYVALNNSPNYPAVTMPGIFSPDVVPLNNNA